LWRKVPISIAFSSFQWTCPLLNSPVGYIGVYNGSH
jgi:hypothetical protein